MANVRHAVNDRAGPSKHPNSNDVERNPGCPVPMPAGCLVGFPLPESLADGVKMVCNNLQCPFRNQYVHKLCFDVLEEKLTKVISCIGAARGWTNAKRRANLWDKKGWNLIQTRCRCPCGLGLMKYDDTEMFLANRDAVVAAANAGPPKPRHRKSKNLPKLNFGNPLSYATMRRLNLFSYPPPRQLDTVDEEVTFSPVSEKPDTEVSTSPPANTDTARSSELSESSEVSDEWAKWTQYSRTPIPLNVDWSPLYHFEWTPSENFDWLPFDWSNMVNSNIADGWTSYAQATSLAPVKMEFWEPPIKLETPAEMLEALGFGVANGNSQKEETGSEAGVNEKVRDGESRDGKAEANNVIGKEERKESEKTEVKTENKLDGSHTAQAQSNYEWDLPKCGKCGIWDHVRFNEWDRPCYGRRDMSDYPMYANNERWWWNQPRCHRSERRDVLKHVDTDRWNQAKFYWTNTNYVGLASDENAFADDGYGRVDPRLFVSDTHRRCDLFTDNIFGRFDYRSLANNRCRRLYPVVEDGLGRFYAFLDVGRGRFDLRSFVDDGYGRFNPHSCFASDCLSFDSSGLSCGFGVGELRKFTDQESAAMEPETFSPNHNNLDCTNDATVHHGVRIDNRSECTDRSENKVKTFSKASCPPEKPNSDPPKMVDVAVQTTMETDTESDHNDEYNDGFYHYLTSSFFLGERFLAEVLMYEEN